MKKLAALLVCAALVSCQSPKLDLSADRSGADWPFYHGNPHGTHYSTLDQINAENVKDLKVAWRFDSGDGFQGGDMEGNPMIVGGRLYFVSPKGRLFCLDAATGKQTWVFNPAYGEPVTRARLRGLAYWSDGRQERILFTFRNQLIAVDAATGKTIAGFGDKGAVDLRQDLDRDPSSVSVNVVSPGVVYKDTIIIGSTGNTPGHVRAYDVRTGKLKWTFRTIPHPGEYGYDTWPEDAWKTAMGANAWSGFTLDPERGIVYLPLASAGMGDKDFYGADRHGDNLFGTSIVALDAKTGKRLWHFQLVKHDLWDRDPPTPPTLVTVRRDGKDIPALAQITKAGVVWVLDRTTGESLFPVTEVPVFASTVPGEQISTTQRLPAAPEPFARQRLTEDMLTQRTPAANAAARAHLAKSSNRGPFDPPSLQGTILFPGMDGGGEYGGAAWDPDTGVLYINANEMAWTMKLKPRVKTADGQVSGAAVYANVCASCHGDDRKGSPPEFPALFGVSKRLSADQITKQVRDGAGRMPAFGAALSPDELKAVVAYISDDSAKPAPEYPSTAADDYAFDGYHRFLDPDGYPAVAPPWGTLNALDLNTGNYLWRIPFGEYPELADKTTGSENYGGAVVTRGGLLFIGATIYDNKFRAFDKKTGKLLWETVMPTSSIATPATYSVGGKQYVAVAAGGGKNPKVKPGGEIIVYSLP
ncbi:pyrrolo-quinoline quinone [Asticcacaulis sp. AC460]|uniref:outer membrane protein assembly factor BamB family protein n=1 Tax=Asticcacaulis sp. AC460 TaxID=1282360 RepID=UPI0003C3DB7D|nr:PQQ-binding-like beta-propeller repeat protein [Asticcacaulis sp. AC460]ESQ91541.1 pyrrolo-quinoline quinone [Asticcacaulis sp. AC460]